MRNYTKAWAAVVIAGTLGAQAASITNLATWVSQPTDWGPTTETVTKFDTNLYHFR